MHLFGLKTEAWFDVWSIEHFISGILIGSLLAWIWTKTKQPPIKENPVPFFLALLMISFMWESVEFYMEAGYSGIEGITHWFQGVEFWGNRLITDPMMMVVGAIVYRRYSHLWLTLPARLFSVVWLITHIFIFPHSMYLHTMFLEK